MTPINVDIEFTNILSVAFASPNMVSAFTVKSFVTVIVDEAPSTLIFPMVLIVIHLNAFASPPTKNSINGALPSVPLPTVLGITCMTAAFEAALSKNNIPLAIVFAVAVASDCVGWCILNIHFSPSGVCCLNSAVDDNGPPAVYSVSYIKELLC